MSKTFSNKINKQGFTLLEMIVSLGVFSVIAVIAVGSLVRITSLNRQAQSLQAAMNNINYILESFSREMRFGSAFHCSTPATFSGRNLSTTDCNVGTSGAIKQGILFKSARTAIDSSGSVCPLINAYWFIRNGSLWDIRKSQQTTCDETISYDTALSLIDSRNVSLTDVTFRIYRNSGGYSRAYVRLVGYSGIKTNERNDFDIRTQVSQRMIY